MGGRPAAVVAARPVLMMMVAILLRLRRCCRNRGRGRGRMAAVTVPMHFRARHARRAELAHIHSARTMFHVDLHLLIMQMAADQ